MEYLSLPLLHQRASRIGLGTWSMGGWMWGGSDESAAIATISRALDEGITFIDTAPVYGFGLSEQLVGKALKQRGNREKVVIATKCGLSWTSKENVFRDSRPTTLIKECEASLKRLQIDHIDLYQIHWPDPNTPIAETANAMLKLLNEGKIKAIGVCNYSVEQMETFLRAAPLHSCQSPFNLFEQDTEKNQLAYCLKNQIAFIGYGSLCRGLLSGKITEKTQFKGDDLRKTDPKFQAPQFTRYLQMVQKLDQWAKTTHQRSILALAIYWALNQGASIALWGARKPEQLDALKELGNRELSRSDLKLIDAIVNIDQ